ncbi:DUF1830 domain-containing protein [Synechococcus sp. PCC 6717]|nr:DUF1830 domain-containing protein [Synechococcus sp. PCC 6717]
MPQIFDPVPHDNCDRILCCYANVTSKIQVVRITNIANWYFERVVFPGQRLVFECPRPAQLEVHCGMMASAILSDTIPCTELLVQEGDDNFFPSDPVTQQRLELLNEESPQEVMSH